MLEKCSVGLDLKFRINVKSQRQSCRTTHEVFSDVAKHDGQVDDYLMDLQTSRIGQCQPKQSSH